jgi:uncharacterized protein
MVRPKTIRRIFFQPNATYFKPAGIPLVKLKETILSFDELEAIRLIDSEGMEQSKAGKKMKISQSTLSRLLKSGRKKLADAITNGHSIKIKGGDFKMVQTKGRGLGLGQGKRNGRGLGKGKFAAGPGGECVCPKCGYKETHQLGQPCYKKKCPTCGSPMARK